METFSRQVKAKWRGLCYRPQVLSDRIVSFWVGWKTSTLFVYSKGKPLLYLYIPNDLPNGHKDVRSGMERSVNG